jgi:hypothetical protein
VGAPESLGRYRQLAVAAVATRFPLNPRARAFLRSEAERYLRGLPSSNTDTAELALFELLRWRDAPTCSMVAEALRGRKHRLAAAQIVGVLLELGADELFVDAFEAIVADGFGEQENGEPIRLARAFAKHHPQRASVYFGTSPADESVAREAAYVAGLLQLDASNQDARSRYDVILRRLRPEHERECGLGLALLQLGLELDVPEAHTLLSVWREAQLSKHVGAKLRAWFVASSQGMLSTRDDKR